MNEFIRFSAKTKNEAITKACIEFETSSDCLEIIVESEGSTGFFGIGSKPSIIKARVKEETESNNKKEALVEKNLEVVEEKTEPTIIETVENVETVEESSCDKSEINNSEEITENAIKFLSDIFTSMNFGDVEIDGKFNAENNTLDLDFKGDETGILIGKRGQTLDSLQYLTSLVVNKNTNEYVRVKLDTEDYRRRRKETLENLAKGIASKVRRTRKQVILEPMNPYERRIIHSTLQNNRFVETVSEGEEPYRHIIVKYKNKNY